MATLSTHDVDDVALSPNEDNDGGDGMATLSTDDVDVEAPSPNEDNDGGDDGDMATLFAHDVDDVACPLMTIMMVVMIWPPCLQIMLMMWPVP